MPHREAYRKTLEYALAIAGSELVLSVRLKVPAGKLKNWLQGIEEIPDRAFLDAIDIISASTPEDIARSRGAIAKPPNGESSPTS